MKSWTKTIPKPLGTICNVLDRAGALETRCSQGNKNTINMNTQQKIPPALWATGGLEALQSRIPQSPQSLNPQGRVYPSPYPCLGNPSGPLVVIWFALVASWLPWCGENHAKGRCREAKGPPRVAKGSQKASKTTPRRTNQSPKGAQTAAWSGLGHPWGGS